MFHRHRYEEVQRDFLYEFMGRMSLEPSFFGIGDLVTLVTSRCIKCGRFKQVQLRGHIGKSAVQHFVDEVERKIS